METAPGAETEAKAFDANPIENASNKSAKSLFFLTINTMVKLCGKWWKKQE
jgi:hypothetical protein